ncbi:unnamed protein product [Gongylonema pulchrum]|uniref:CLAVATA3/ESR (CLE)-related protein n=1 Tax=Gongylonema pulchrum TaxID=637853 RepID=A0A183CY39_9BILA|nr:unnamed protein product [Gongylonema pulchrum]
MALKRSAAAGITASQGSVFPSPFLLCYKMFHTRPSQRRNVFLNILSLVGAYWIITTLISFSNNDMDNHVVDARAEAMLKEPLGRQLQENGNLLPDDSKQQLDKPVSANANYQQILRARRNHQDAEKIAEEEKFLKKTSIFEKITGEDNNGLEKPNIPQPRRFIYMESSPIYKKDDPNQPGEYGAAVSIDKNVSRDLGVFCRMDWSRNLPNKLTS